MDKIGTFNPQLYNTNAEIAEAFIPFIEAHTPLRRNSAPLPVIIDAAENYEAAFYLQSQHAAGVYQQKANFVDQGDNLAKRGRLIFNHDLPLDPTRIASVFLHELVHWMQDVANPHVDQNEASYTAREFQAYSVQAAWLREHELDPYADFPEVFGVIEQAYGKPGSPAPLFCRIKSFTLDGKRYRISTTLPTGTIEYLARFWHVSTTDAEICDIIRRRAMDAPRRADWPERMIAQAQRYAMSRHRANQKLYRYVQLDGSVR